MKNEGLVKVSVTNKYLLSNQVFNDSAELQAANIQANFVVIFLRVNVLNSVHHVVLKTYYLFV